MRRKKAAESGLGKRREREKEGEKKKQRTSGKSETNGMNELGTILRGVETTFYTTRY